MLPDPISRLKRQLAGEIQRAIGHHGWWMAKQLLGLDESCTCKLLRGDLERFSLQRLVRLLARIDREVTITVTSRAPANYTLYPPGTFKRRSLYPYWDPTVPIESRAPSDGSPR